jgi:hypothetical protein
MLCVRAPGPEPAQGNGCQGGQNQNNQGPTVYTTYTAREYVHSPGYVDEFICEIDTGGTTDTFWWVLQDANYDVVALVSDGSAGASTTRGEVARQYAWSPYGELLRADIYDTSAPMSRLGHQGLFHDRLDANILAEPMVAFSDQLIQNRNRTLSPRLARFLQSDPNGTGTSVIDQLSMLGTVAPQQGAGPDGEQMFGDGGSLFLYAGARPTVERDPTGLFFGVAGLAVSGGEMALSIDGTFNEMLEGIGLKTMLNTMLSAYSAAQSIDADWAGDWSAADDAYSAGGGGGAGYWEWFCAGEAGAGAAEGDGGGGLALAGRSRSKLKGVSRARYTQLRKAWNAKRQKIWRDEARNNPQGWSKAQRNRMERGLAPRGWVIHHRKPLSQGGTNDAGNLVMMRASDHRRHFGALHSHPPKIRLPASQDGLPAIWNK